MDPNALCQDKSGFLFKHSCSHMAAHACRRCGKPICMQHTRITSEQETVCVNCVKAELQQSDDWQSNRCYGGSASHYRNDPFFYGGYYYPGWGYYGSGYWGHDNVRQSHANDFTEGDGESLTNPGDEPFETDLGAS